MSIAHSYIHSLIQYLPSDHHVCWAVLDARGNTVNNIDVSLP